MEELRFEEEGCELSLGDGYSFLRRKGSVASCGNNDYGQLGLPSAADSQGYFIPLSVWKVAQVACGKLHTFLRFETGKIAATGLNDNGQLGVGDKVNRSTFVLVPTSAPVAQVACGRSHTFLRFEDGTIAACGSNYNRQLGQDGGGGPQILRSCPDDSTGLTGYL